MARTNGRSAWDAQSCRGVWGQISKPAQCIRNDHAPALEIFSGSDVANNALTEIVRVLGYVSEGTISNICVNITEPLK